MKTSKNENKLDNKSDEVQYRSRYVYNVEENWMFETYGTSLPYVSKSPNSYLRDSSEAALPRSILFPKTRNGTFASSSDKSNAYWVGSWRAVAVMREVKSYVQKTNYKVKWRLKI